MPRKAQEKPTKNQPGLVAQSVKPAQTSRPKSTSREDLSAEGRATLAMRVAAQRQRGKPPSI